MRGFLLAVLVLGFLSGGCATSSESEGDVTRNRNLISLEDLSSLPSLSAYEAVQRLRPAWLLARGPRSVGAATLSFPRVMVDGIPLGDINTLKDLRTENIQELRFISSRDATTRMGTGYMAGLIEIITRR